MDAKPLDTLTIRTGAGLELCVRRLRRADDARVRPAGHSSPCGAATPADAAAAVGRLAAELAGAVLRVVNEPDGTLLLAAFGAVGAKRTLVQHEMSVSLAGSS